MKRIAGIILTFSIQIALGAQPGGTISGFVRDVLSAKPLTGVNVYLQNTAIGTATDDAGFYAIKNVPIGQYQICFDMIGYQRPPLKIIKIKSGDRLELDMLLKVEAIHFDQSVTVTATRGHSLVTEVPASVNVVKLEEIESRNPQNLAEALQNVQGVYFKDYGGLGNTKTISLRGSSAEQVLVMLDGQRLNNPQNGQVDFASLAVEGVERIEVVRGGSSALYGSDAVGGVINIITKSSHNKEAPNRLSGSLKYTLGSFNSASFENEMTFRMPVGEFSGSYKFLESEGNFPYLDDYDKEQTRQNADVKSQDVYLKFTRPLGDSLYSRLLDLSYKYYSSERGAPGTIDDQYKFATMWDRANQYNVIFSGKVFNLFNDLRAQMYRHNSWSHYRNIESSAKVNSRFTVQTNGMEIQMKTVPIPQASLTYGFGLRSDKLHNLQTDTLHQRQSWYAFLVNESTLGFQSGFCRSVAVVSSVRFDQTTDYGSKLSPKVGTVLNFGDTWQTSFKINFGGSYRAPTFNDLYWPADPWTEGNPNLKPESGLDYDVGFRWQLPILGGIYFESTYFHNRMKDLIIWRETNSIWSPENVDKALIQGIENGINLKPFGKFLTIAGNYSYLDARNKTNSPTVYDKRLIYRPRHNANLNLNFAFHFVTLNYQYSYTGLRYTTSANTKFLPSYHTSDVTLSLRPKTTMKDFLISVQMKNIFNERYQVVARMPIPGREMRLAIKVGF